MAKTNLKLGPHDAGTCLSADEFASAERQAPFIYERVQGRLVVMSPAGPQHRQVTRPFRRNLGGYWSQHPDMIDDVDVEGWVSTSPDDDRIPGICVYLRGPSSMQMVPHRVPDLILEFVSADRSDQQRDDVDKRAEYHAIGVKEYVIVDRFQQTVLVLSWQPRDYAERWLGRSDDYTTLLLPGLRVAIREAFAS